MNLAGLSSEQHRNLKLRRIPSYRHAAGYHSVSLAAAEIPRAALTYPVLFACNEAGFHLVALLGLVQNENQSVEGDAWRAGYIPAAIRAYPFRLAGEQVLIDESAPHFDDIDGEALFTEEGEPTAVMDEALGFLRSCHAAVVETQHWCKRLSDLGLLAEHRAEVISPQGTRYRLDGFYAIDGGKIPLLPDATLTVLVRDGSLARIHAHLLSLENLVKLAHQRDRLNDGNGSSGVDGPEPV